MGSLFIFRKYYRFHPLYHIPGMKLKIAALWQRPGQLFCRKVEQLRAGIGVRHVARFFRFVKRFAQVQGICAQLQGFAA